MHKSRSRRRQIIRRTIIYTLMTTFVVGLVTVLVLLMLGYRFNRLTNKIEQGGLVQFITKPSGAAVTVGNAHLTDITPSKITVNPGHYLVKMEKSGYRTWQKPVDIEAGKVLWLNYAQLVPEKITTKTVASFKSLSEARVSPTGHYYALLPDAAKPIITVVDMTDSKYSRSAIDITTQAGNNTTAWRYSIISWSSDNNYLLMKRQNKTAAEWLLIDRREPTKSQNLTDKYKLPISNLLFEPNSSNRLVGHTANGDVRMINVAEGTLSPTLLQNVVSVYTYDNALLYVQRKSSAVQSLGYLSLDSTTGRELLQRTGTQKVLVDVGSYYGDIYMVITTGNDVDVYRLSSLPHSTSTSPLTMTSLAHFQTAAPPLYASIRSNGRFVIVQSRQGFLTYDLELAKMTTTNLGNVVADKLVWLDKYHIGYVAGRQFTIIEFDGANRQEIAEASAGFDGDQSSDDKYVYSFLRTTYGVELRRSQMTVSN